MKRILGMLGLALLLAALLTVFVTGSLLAAGDNTEAAYNHYQHDVCPCDEPYGDCDPNEWEHLGPRGQQNGI